MPREQKMSRLAVTMNRDYNYMELAEVSFDMANFKYGKYDGMRLFLNQVASNSQYTVEQDSFIEIAKLSKGSDVVILCDRGLMDGSAYVSRSGW